jgi:hypothetical protein
MFLLPCFLFHERQAFFCSSLLSSVADQLPAVSHVLSSFIVCLAIAL